MLVASGPLIRCHYDEWKAAAGAERLLSLLSDALAPDFVYTDPAVVLLGRDAFLRTLGEAPAVPQVRDLAVTVRDMGAHAVAAGQGSLPRDARGTVRRYAFTALWRRDGGRWLCVAHRGAPALLSVAPSAG